MPKVAETNRSKPSRVGSKRWTRVRQAYQSGELDPGHLLAEPENKRSRRNALADISTVSTSTNAKCEKHRFHQLVERVRELQNEIAPDLLLYQMPSNYSSFSAVTPGSNISGGSLPAYPHRHSMSLGSNSPNASLPQSRSNVSAKLLERAHQIPERSMEMRRQLQLGR